MRKPIVMVAVLALGVGAAWPAQSAAVYGDPACPGVQPGAAVYDIPQKEFTQGFLFSGSDGGLWTLTTGDILDGHRSAYLETQFKDVDDTLWPAGKGPRLKDSSTKPVFEVRLLQKRESIIDVAWMRVLRGTAYAAEVCAFGPTSGREDRVDDTPATAFIYGQGGYHDADGHPFLADRTDLLPRGLNDITLAALATPQEASDGGAPVLLAASDGQPSALGISRGSLGGTNPERQQVGTYVMRLSALIPLAERALGIRLKLLTFEAGKVKR